LAKYGKTLLLERLRIKEMKNRKYLCKNAQSLNLFRQSLRVSQVDLDCRYFKYHNFSNQFHMEHPTVSSI